MRVTVKKGRAEGEISAPPSKSACHRALIFASLSDGTTVRGVEFSDDVSATLSCLEKLGAKVSVSGGDVTLGMLDPKKIKECTLDCSESGSTLRFILPLCLISGARVTLTGSEKLLSRPLDVYENICAERGLTFEMSPKGVTVAGPLEPGVFKVSMAKSSQFTTGLLIALSALGGNSAIEVENGAESVSYAKLTVSLMNRFGIRVFAGENRYCVIPSKPASLDLRVEGDWSNAAFLSALNEVGGSVSVTGLDPLSVQGDRIYPELFRAVSCGKEADLSDCPDLAPVLFALAAYRGGGRFTGTSRLRYKESDRAEKMKEELAKFGSRLALSDNEVSVSGNFSAPSEVLCGHNDHRVVMALSVLCTVTGGVIEGAEAVSKSYPSFFGDLEKLGIEVEYDET